MCNVKDSHIVTDILNKRARSPYENHLQLHITDRNQCLCQEPQVVKGKKSLWARAAEHLKGDVQWPLRRRFHCHCLFGVRCVAAVHALLLWL